MLKKTVYILAAILAMSLMSLQVQAKSSSVEQGEVTNIEFVDLNGDIVRLSDFRGKWIVVNFWATWCPPCIKEIPELVMFHEKHQDKRAIVLGVNYETNPVEEVKAFAEDLMVNFPIVRIIGGADGRTTPFGLLKGLPTTYMISPEGLIVATTTGLVSMQDLEDFMDAYEKKHGKS